MTFVFGLALVAYGNLASLALGTTAVPSGGWIGATLGVVIAAASLLWSRARRLDLEDLGLRPDTALRGALVGLGVALAVAVPSLLVLRFPPLLGEPVRYAPLASMALADLGLRVAVTMPLDTVLPEELAFRGVLLGALARTRGTVAAALLSALAFAAWHLVIVQATLARTNLAENALFAALGLVGAFAAVFAGGVVFAVLRVATRSLAAPLAAHWAFNAAILVGLRTIGT